MNMVTDAAAWLRRKLGIRQSLKISRQLRYVILAVILVGSAITGTLLWEWINPVAALGRIFVFGTGATLWLVTVIFYLTYLLLSMAGVVTFVQLVRYMVSLVLKA